MKKDRFCMAFFSALANPLRIAILQRLVEKERSVSELVGAVEEERTLVSHNLAQLLRVQLISFKKAGKERIYYANPQIVPPLFYLIENFVCPGCSFRGTCKTIQKRSMGIQPVPLQRETCRGCIRK